MGSIYCDKPLKKVVQSRVEALSEPDEGRIVSEKQALVDMLAEEYRREYRHKKARQKR